jgi:hypothetical protein
MDRFAMSALAVTDLEPVVEACYRLFDDGVRRWRDLDIAEWLGLERERNIRTNLIQPNREELERHGPLLEIQATPRTGGPTATEYWLTFAQAMVICSQSRTPRAEDVRTVMIQVFEEFVNGQISTAPRMELRALEVAADRIVAPILNGQREFHSQVLVKLDRHEIQIANVTHEVITMKREVSARRREFSKKSRASYIGTVQDHYNSKCPCCRAVVIVCDGQLLPSANFEHWHGSSKARVQDGWLTCDKCNEHLNDSEFRLEKSSAFRAFHDARRVYEGNQPDQRNLEF